jgi:hypothetical protein
MNTAKHLTSLVRSPPCVKQCDFPRPPTIVTLYPCEKKDGYCCGTDNVTDCCNNGRSWTVKVGAPIGPPIGATAWQLPPWKYVADAINSSSSGVPSATASGGSASDTSRKDDSGSKLGIALGLGLGIPLGLMILGALVFVGLQLRNQNKYNNTPKGTQQTGYHPGSVYAYQGTHGYSSPSSPPGGQYHMDQPMPPVELANNARPSELSAKPMDPSTESSKQ